MTDETPLHRGGGTDRGKIAIAIHPGVGMLQQLPTTVKHRSRLRFILWNADRLGAAIRLQELAPEHEIAILRRAPNGVPDSG